MEICLVKVLKESVVDSDENRFRVREVGYTRFDPRSYCGYGFYIPWEVEAEGYCYNEAREHVFGTVNGTVAIHDKFAMKAFLRRVIRKYHPQLENLYDQMVIQAEDEKAKELGCL